LLVVIENLAGGGIGFFVVDGGYAGSSDRRHGNYCAAAWLLCPVPDKVKGRPVSRPMLENVSGSAIEGGDGRSLVVLNIKYGIELGDLQ
jgi:membrane-bound lytic murein transglycosylase